MVATNRPTFVGQERPGGTRFDDAPAIMKVGFRSVLNDENPSPTTMEFSEMTRRWSSKPKEHRAARVRDNQRRHRARVRAQTADLERQLAETRQRLEDALERNSVLVSELERLRSVCTGKSCANQTTVATDAHPPPIDAGTPVSPVTSDSSSLSSGEPPSSPYLSPDEDRNDGPTSTNARAHLPGSAKLQRPLPPDSNIRFPDEIDFTAAPSTGSKSAPAAVARRACVGDMTACRTPATLNVLQSRDDVEMVQQQGDGSHFPPTAPTESTIPCAIAFDMIKRQNYNGQDLDAISALLAPGFRRAIIQGDGCRVDSTRVFSALDMISS